MTQTLDWHQCGSSFYRKFHVYDMKWQNLSIANVQIAVEKYAGHIAVANNFTESRESKPQFTIVFYTSTGQLLNKVQWKNGHAICMDWSVDTEQLIVVNAEGRVFVYSLFGVENEAQRFSMGQEAAESKIKSCQLFDSYAGVGLCCLTALNRFYLLNNLREPMLWRMPELSGKTRQEPNCWTVLSKERDTKVVCVFGNEIFCLERGKTPEALTLNCETKVKAFSMISLSPDKSKFVLLSENGYVVVVPTDFGSRLRECDTGYRIRPKALTWCGESSVALLFGTSLELIDLSKDSIQFPLDSETFIASEIDGIRLFSEGKQEFLGRIPECCVETFQVAALEPSATLLEAWKEYESGSYRAFDYIKMTNKLEKAVETCVEAALQEYSVENQKCLLYAASLGKLFTPDIDKDIIYRTTGVLKTLNNIRHTSIGMPLTYAQFIKLTPAALIDRLMLRGQWPLCVSICQRLKVEPDRGVHRVLACWLKKKIFDKSKPDSNLTEKIGWKLAEFPNVTLYARAAQWAAEAGQTELATAMLENETDLKTQVAMLMKLGRNEKALAKACDSGDHDMISFVILHLRQSLEKKGDLDFILRKFPIAFAVYKNYCTFENPELLKALLKQTDDFTTHASCWMREANRIDLTENTFQAAEKIDKLKEAESNFKMAKDDFFVQQLQDQCKLLKTQEDLEEKYGEQFLDLSLRETIRRLVVRPNSQTFVVNLRKEFQVSDKQYWWWKIEALAAHDQWEELAKFAASRKSPIGYLPFVEVCAERNNLSEAEQYLPKVSADEKVSAYIAMNRLEEAATFAFQRRDVNSLNRILSQCDAANRHVSDKIGQMKQQLGSKR